MKFFTLAISSLVLAVFVQVSKLSIVFFFFQVLKIYILSNRYLLTSFDFFLFCQFVNGLPSDVHRGTTGGTTEPDRRSVQSKASSRSSFSGHLDNGHVETVTVPTLPSSGSGSQSKPKQTGVLKKILSYIPFVGSKSPGSTPTPTGIYLRNFTLTTNH